jgi:hypothetical protein
MIRRLALTACLAMPLFLGCSAPADEKVGGVENVGTTAEALSGGANGKTFYLTSFDGANQLIGLNDQGKGFTGLYGAQTRFRAAALDKYAPTDPCRDPAASYNSYIATNDTVGFNAALTAMVPPAIGPVAICKARVHVDKLNVIVSFEPMP